MSKTKDIEYTVQIWKEGHKFVAHGMPLDMMGSGRTPEEARRALDEAVHAFLVTAADMGTLEEILKSFIYLSVPRGLPVDIAFLMEISLWKEWQKKYGGCPYTPDEGKTRKLPLHFRLISSTSYAKMPGDLMKRERQ